MTSYQRTQIYLDPDDHRRLRAEAHARGISLAALLREIASAHVAEGAQAYETAKSWDAIIGVAGEGEPTDIARREADYKREMWEAKARESGLSATRPPRRTPPKKAAARLDQRRARARKPHR